jgi:hypothetical protein
MGNKEKPKYEESKPKDNTVKRTKSGAEVTIPGETERKSRRLKKLVNKHISQLKIEKRGGSGIDLNKKKVLESTEILKNKVKDPISSQKILEDAKIKAFNYSKAGASNDEIDREAVLKRIKLDLEDPVSKCWSMLRAGKLNLSIYERAKLLSDLAILDEAGDHLTDEQKAIKEQIGRKVNGHVQKEETRIKRERTKSTKKSISWITFSAIWMKWDGETIKGLCGYFQNNINYFLFISILISCYILYSKMNTFVSIRFGSYSDEEKYKLGNILKWIIIVFTVIIVFFFWPCNTWLLDNWFYAVSNTLIYRSVKLTLGLILGFLVIYINLNTLGIYSWKTLYSFISILIIIFIILISYNDSFSLYVNKFIGIYIMTYIIMIINGCFSNLFMYFEYPIDQNNIKHIIPGKYKRLAIENEVLILEANSNGKKRELDTDDMEITELVPSSPVKSDRMDIDDEYDNVSNNGVDIDYTGGNDEQPLKKHKGDGKNTENNIYSEQQYVSDICKLEKSDLDFESYYIDKTTGLSNSVILNDINVRRRLGLQLKGGIDSLQHQAALRNNNIIQGRMKLINGHWWHTKVSAFRKLSLPKQEKIVNEFKDMLAYNSGCIDNAVELYNNLRPEGSSLTRSEIELKVEAWNRIIVADPSKITAIQQNLEDFVEFAPNTADNIKIKNIIVKQVKGNDNTHSILRQWEKKIQENSNLEEGIPMKTWARSESKVLREIYWRKKVNGECSILEHIERRAERIQADKNNQWRADKDRYHENNMKKKEAELHGKGTWTKWV